MRNASAHENHPTREKAIFLSPRRVSPFLAWGGFHARSRFARSTIPEEKWGTTRSLYCVLSVNCFYLWLLNKESISIEWFALFLLTP